MSEDWFEEAKKAHAEAAALVKERDALRACGDEPCGECIACLKRIVAHLHEWGRTMREERDALRAALEKAATFTDVTVRGWLSDQDEHKNCDSSCSHRGYVDQQYEVVEALAQELWALLRPTGDQG